MSKPIWGGRMASSKDLKQLRLLRALQSRPVAGGMGWQMPFLGNRKPAFCQPWKSVSNIFCNLFFAAKERSPEILIELNPGPCDVLKTSFFSSTHIIHLTLIT